MLTEYRQIIEEFVEERRKFFHKGETVDRANLLRAQCHTLCERIISKIPELKLVKGFIGEVNNPLFSEHFWLETNGGIYLDPTVEQFPYLKNSVYTVFDETVHEVRLGRCMNCGEALFGLISRGTLYFCDPWEEQDCEKEYNYYMRAEMSRLMR